jgi:endonuclease-3
MPKRSESAARAGKRASTRGPGIDTIIAKITSALGEDDLTAVASIAKKQRDPFKILISTILSLRTKDEVTAESSRRLFALADTPAAIARLTVRSIEKAIYPAGFYKTKARTIKEIARRIETECGGVVPDTIEELLTFKGVGRKTANLVVTIGYGKPGICVDTHVHRICNRLGLVDTPTPDKTEFVLRDILPRKYWIGINELMVLFGQQVCKPISPHCSTCPLDKKCPKIDVGKRR